MPGDFAAERVASDPYVTEPHRPTVIFKTVVPENVCVELPRQATPGTVYSIMNLGPDEITVIARQVAPLTRWQHFWAALTGK
jgi:hypothetical protein